MSLLARQRFSQIDAGHLPAKMRMQLLDLDRHGVFPETMRVVRALLRNGTLQHCVVNITTAHAPVSRARCSVLNAASQNRDRNELRWLVRSRLCGAPPTGAAPRPGHGISA